MQYWRLRKKLEQEGIEIKEEWLKAGYELKSQQNWSKMRIQEGKAEDY